MPRKQTQSNACTPSYVAGDSTQGAADLGPTDAARQAVDGTEQQQKRAEQSLEDRAEMEQLTNEAIRVMNNKFYGDTLKSADAMRAAVVVQKGIRKQANETAQQNYGILEGIQRILTGTGIGASSWWTNLKNKIYGLFVNDRAEMVKWLSYFCADKGVLEPYKYKLVQMFERIQPTQRAFLSKFRQRQEKLLNDFTDVFNKAGLSKEEAAWALGLYAAARHAPERNAMLLARWQSLVDQAKRQGATICSDGTNVHVYEKQIELLNQYIDSSKADLDKMDKGDAKIFRSAGWTNRQAQDVMQDVLNKTGISKEDADRFASRLTDEYNFILQERARNGTLDKDMRMPEFQYYVPMISRNGETLGNYAGAPNDATPYNPGSYYAALGRNDPPQSAWTTLQFYSNKASAEIATRDFGFALFAIKQHLDAQYGRDQNGKPAHGLQSIGYGDLMRAMTQSGVPGEAMRSMYNNGGFVALVPQKNGKMERRFFFFTGPDRKFGSTTFSTQMLNKGLSASFHTSEPGPIVDAAARATSFMGQLTTRYTPLFSPISGSRDFIERALNMANRTYNKSGGGYVGGVGLASEFMFNIHKAGRLLYKGMRGQLDPSTEEGRIYQEFLDHGVAQRFNQRTYTHEFSMEDIERNANINFKEGDWLGQAKKDPRLNKVLNTLGSKRDAFVSVIDNWNDYYQNVAAFDHYYTLRKNGVSADDAASGALEMMNMAQRGSLTPWLQALAPFVTPTVQSGTAMLRSLGLGANTAKDIWKQGWKGYATIAAAFAAYNIFMGLSKQSMGTDEYGNSRFDALSLDEASRALPIGYGNEGDYIRFPIGFGFAQLGAKMAVGADRVSRGQMSLPDLLFDLGFTAMKNVAPGNWPSYNFSDHPLQFMMSMFTPTPLRPIQEATANINYFGSEIYMEPRNPYQSPADMGRSSTPRQYHSFAKGARDLTGLDLQPEIYEHMERGYALGPFKALYALSSQGDDIYKGSSRPSSLDSMHPILAGLGMASWLGKQANATRSLFYEAQRHYADRIRAEGIDFSAPPGSSSEAAEAYRRDVLTQAGWMPGDVEDCIRIWKAEKTLQQQGRDFNSQYMNAWENMDTSRELKEAFDKLDEDNLSVYAEALQGLNYYGGEA